MKVFYLKFIIMDYEKKYKEALERAKNYHDNNFSFGTTKLTEAIFPELREKPLTPFQQCLNCILRGVYYAEVPDKKVNEFILNVVRTRTDELIKLAKRHEYTDCQLRESKNERIIREMLEYFTVTRQSDFCSHPERQVWITWLEKQKEQEKEELVYRLNGLMQDYIKEGKDDEEKEHRLKCYQLFWDALEDTSYFEQKEHHIPWYDYQKSKEAGYTIVPNEEYEQLIKQKEQKPQVFCEAKAYDLGYKQGKEDAIKEQKPAEWSEEDESELTAIIYCVSQAIKASKDENERNSLLSAKKWLQDKLSFRVKSLHPSWKPSEEQMDALKELIDDANKARWVTPGATELYEQLKKL